MQLETSSLSNLQKQLQYYSYCEARGIQFDQHPIMLTLKHQNGNLKVTDSQNNSFNIFSPHSFASFIQNLFILNVSQLVSKIYNWEFEYKFNQAQQIENIVLNAQYLIVHTTNGNQHRLNGVRLTIIPTLSSQNFSSNLKGYLIRISKKSFIEIKQTDQTFNKLIRFIPDTRSLNILTQQALKKRQDKGSKNKNRKNQGQQYDYIKQLNTSGIKILQKLQKVLCRNQIYTHMMNIQLRNMEDYKFIRKMAYSEQSKQ